eukprot:1178922-Prorocentrum_minimum.AAC.4
MSSAFAVVTSARIMSARGAVFGTHRACRPERPVTRARRSCPSSRCSSACASSTPSRRSVTGPSWEYTSDSCVRLVRREYIPGRRR